MAAGQGIVEDAEGFMKPTDIGFSDGGHADLNNNLKMRLFPFHELKKVYAADPFLNQVFIQLFGISNIAHLMGPNFQQMPGVILSTSIGTGPFRVIENDENVPWGEIVREATALTGAISVQDWVEKYMCGQFGMIANHLYFYRDQIGGHGWGPNWGGLCMYMDITESTLLARNVNVSQVLEKCINTLPNFSITEHPDYKNEAKDALKQALTWLQGRYAGRDLVFPLYYVFILGIYAVFRKFKHLHLGAAWATEPPNPDEPGIGQAEATKRFQQQADYNNYNLRIYLIKRRGRLLYDINERGLNHVPVGDMPAPAGEQNLGRDTWLAMAQYYRLMSCFMKPTTLNYNQGGIALTFAIKTLRRFVSRDGHATGSSSWTALYDAQLFNSAAAKGGRLVVLGTCPTYKSTRHASLIPQQNTMLLGIFAGHGSYNNSITFGILAGICWFFNPSMEETFIGYPELKLPFRPLRSVHYAGEDVLIPDLMLNADVPDYLSWKDQWTLPEYQFFMYGVDEYVLSLFVSAQFREVARWDELNLLFFPIHWLSGIVERNSSEFYPLLNEYISGLAAVAKATHGDIPLRSFFLLPESEDLKNISLETFFSSKNTPYHLANFPIISEVKFVYRPGSGYEVELQASKGAFASVFPKLIEYNPLTGNYEYADATSAKCLMKYLHRYDRPFYWKQDARYQMSQRDNGTVPNKLFDAIAGLQYTIQNQIPRACGVGFCVPNDERARPTAGTCSGGGAAAVGAAAAGAGVPKALGALPPQAWPRGFGPNPLAPAFGNPFAIKWNGGKKKTRKGKKHAPRVKRRTRKQKK